MSSANSSASSSSSSDPSSNVAVTGEKNPRGIPSAVFVEDIALFLKTTKKDAQTVIEEIDVMLQKYKVYEANLEEKRSRLKSQLPDIAASIESVEMLQTNKKENATASTFYNLSDQVYVHAEVPPANRVCLWLGANVMLEYTYDEALELLQTNQGKTKALLGTTSEDLSFVREQIITLQVNMARIYNWEVKERRSTMASEVGVTLASK